MFKVIFVLVINAYHGGITTIDFTTHQQCETAKEQVQATIKRGTNFGAVCIEKQIPLKKTKCKIINDSSYRNRFETYKAANLDGYPYPVAIECIKE